MQKSMAEQASRSDERIRRLEEESRKLREESRELKEEASRSNTQIKDLKERMFEKEGEIKVLLECTQRTRFLATVAELFNSVERDAIKRALGLHLPKIEEIRKMRNAYLHEFIPENTGRTSESCGRGPTNNQNAEEKRDRILRLVGRVKTMIADQDIPEDLRGYSESVSALAASLSNYPEIRNQQ